MSNSLSKLKPLKKNTSLTFRLLSFVGLVTVIIFLGFGLYIENTAREHFLEQDHTELKITIKSLEKQIQTVTEQKRLTEHLDIIMSTHPDIFAYVESIQGKVYLANDYEGDIGSFLKDQIQQQQVDYQQLQMWLKGDNHYRILASSIKNYQNQSVTIIVGMNIDFHRHYLQMFRQNLWVGAVIACLLMIGLSWLIVRHGLKPIGVISHQIQNITTDQLNTRLVYDSVPAELNSLVHSFNLMLENIEEVFKRQSQFSSDIAHELRTPITSLMMQTEISLSKSRTLEEYKDILYSNLEELAYLTKMINDMLFLAKATKEQMLLNKTTINLEKELMALIEYFEPLAEEANVGFNIQGKAPLIEGDRSMIQRMLSNLLSNAIKYAKPQTQIDIQFAELANYGLVSITNIIDKPLSAEQLERVFDRFYRADFDRDRNKGGVGIGLSIVKSIIDIHQGKITLTKDDQQLTFSLSLKIKL